MTLILNERQHEFNHQFNLKSLSIIHGGEGDRMTGQGLIITPNNTVSVLINTKCFYLAACWTCLDMTLSFQFHHGKKVFGYVLSDAWNPQQRPLSSPVFRGKNLNTALYVLLCVYMCVWVCSEAYHFFDLSLGGGFRGIKNSALIGCMSHRATNKQRVTERER